MMPRHLVLACCVAVLSAAACGDDDGGDGGGGGGSVDTGLPPTDTLDSLDEEDATQACVETAQSLNSVLSDSELEKISCVVAALSLILEDNSGSLTSADEAECKEISQDCMNGEINGEPIEDIETDVVQEADCVDAGASQTFEGCDATVADYERCAGKVASEVRSRLLAIKCEALKDPSGLMRTLTQDIDVSETAECKTLREKCPDLALSGGGEE